MFEILKSQLKLFALLLRDWPSSADITRRSAQQQIQQLLIVDVGERQINIQTASYNLGAGAQIPTPICVYIDMVCENIFNNKNRNSFKLVNSHWYSNKKVRQRLHS